MTTDAKEPVLRAHKGATYRDGAWWINGERYHYVFELLHGTDTQLNDDDHAALMALKADPFVMDEPRPAAREGVACHDGSPNPHAAVLAAVDRWVEARTLFPLQREECDAADAVETALRTLRTQEGK